MDKVSEGRGKKGGKFKARLGLEEGWGRWTRLVRVGKKGQRMLRKELPKRSYDCFSR